MRRPGGTRVPPGPAFSPDGHGLAVAGHSTDGGRVVGRGRGRPISLRRTRDEPAWLQHAGWASPAESGDGALRRSRDRCTSGRSRRGRGCVRSTRGPSRSAGRAGRDVFAGTGRRAAARAGGAELRSWRLRRRQRSVARPDRLRTRPAAATADRCFAPRRAGLALREGRASASGSCPVRGRDRVVGRHDADVSSMAPATRSGVDRSARRVRRAIRIWAGAAGPPRAAGSLPAGPRRLPRQSPRSSPRAAGSTRSSRASSCGCGTSRRCPAPAPGAAPRAAPGTCRRASPSTRAATGSPSCRRALASTVVLAAPPAPCPRVVAGYVASHQGPRFQPGRAAGWRRAWTDPTPALPLPGAGRARPGAWPARVPVLGSIAVRSAGPVPVRGRPRRPRVGRAPRRLDRPPAAGLLGGHAALRRRRSRQRAARGHGLLLRPGCEDLRARTTSRRARPGSPASCRGP